MQVAAWKKTRRRRSGCSRLGCGFLVLIAIPLLLIVAGYLIAPLRTNILVLGIDYTPPGSSVGRSDTNIIISVNPLKPTINMLSIPRDLWVPIPGYGENRINTAHFFAESEQTGSGPYKAMETIRANFNVRVGYYLRFRFDSFREVVDAFGGVDIDLAEPVAGYPAGRHHLTGNKALAFARNRTGSDDFFRMEQGQILVKALLRQSLQPAKWPRIPAAGLAFLSSVDTNIPVWQWPRLGLALLRAGPDGIDNRIIQREMVTPYITDQGANILLPDWNQINLLVEELFNQ
jgi:LCP family protein required for cell wall assembly